MAKRRKFSAEFKARVALEALVGDRTLAELAKKHDIHPNMIALWKRQAKERLPELFVKGNGSAAADKDALKGQHLVWMTGSDSFTLGAAELSASPKGSKEKRGRRLSRGALRNYCHRLWFPGVFRDMSSRGPSPLHLAHPPRVPRGEDLRPHGHLQFCPAKKGGEDHPGAQPPKLRIPMKQITYSD